MQKKFPGCQHKIPLMADSPTIKEFVSQAEKKNNKNTFVIFFIHAALGRHQGELTKKLW